MLGRITIFVVPEKSAARKIDKATTVDAEDSIEASQTVRAVIATATLLDPSAPAPATARQAATDGAFWVTTYERTTKRYFVVETDGEVYGAIFEVPPNSPVALDRHRADRQQERVARLAFPRQLPHLLHARRRPDGVFAREVKKPRAKALGTPQGLSS